jgi:putative Holliday junction resolvase
MARIISIDFGLKRCGIATTDPLQIIATALATVETKDLMDFLEKYFKQEKVDKLIFGLPTHADGNTTNLKPYIDTIVSEVSKKYPDLNIDFQDESFTSFEAKKIVLQSGIKKKNRRDKALYDKISAVLILQRYLKHI